MANDLVRRRVGEKAQILAARGFVISREPILLARGDWAEVDLLAAEFHLGPRRLARRWRNILARHAEHALIPPGRDLEIGNLDDQMSSACTVSVIAASRGFPCRRRRFRGLGACR